MAAQKGICASVAEAIFEYDTAKIVHIKSKKVGLINRMIQLLIIVYIIGYVIVYKKGYQETEIPYSSITTKLKGVAVTNLTGANKSLSLYGDHFVWDSADYVIPPEENDAVFVTTNMIITPSQTQSLCPEDVEKFPSALCKADSDCPKGVAIENGHGVTTGKCVNSTSNETVKACQIYAWCPLENDKLPMPGFNLSKSVPLLDAAMNFTLLIKNTVQFPKFGETRRNIKDVNNSSYLKHCLYDEATDPLCPVFKLGKIAGYLLEDNFESLAYEGGVVGIILTWSCNFDAIAYGCSLKYSFRRLDNANAPIARGYNFRHARYFVHNEKLYRSLIKAYGIRFVVSVQGQGGKFSAVPLFVNIGSGLALLGIATILCDIVVLYILKKKYFYREKKYLMVEESEDDSQDTKLENKPNEDSPINIRKKKYADTLIGNEGQ